MSDIPRLTDPWRNEYLVVGVSTAVAAGELRPISFGLAAVNGGGVTEMRHAHIGWPAVSGAMEFADGVFLRAASSDTLVITRDAGVGLRVLMDALEASLGVGMMPIEVGSMSRFWTADSKPVCDRKKESRQPGSTDDSRRSQLLRCPLTVKPTFSASTSNPPNRSCQSGRSIGGIGVTSPGVSSRPGWWSMPAPGESDESLAFPRCSRRGILRAAQTRKRGTMATDKRGYVYISERVAGDPTRRYVGKGPRAEAALAEIEARRAERARQAEAARLLVEAYTSVEAATASFSNALDRMVEIVMRGAGYHRHDRGFWRRNRRGKERDARDGQIVSGRDS